ncbi:MAG: hypothetical protein EBZ77_00795 [Chitinophagia bacterium]|nr:hypothetical protein [Chitinophagia bacterium]
MRGRTVSVVDNGGIPFRVRLRQGTATISALVPRSGSSGIDSYAEWGTVEYKRAWIGMCPTELGTQVEWWHGGNSVLLQTGDRTLVYIGTSIKSFVPRPNDTIVSFVSPMGNSAVPYPYAIGHTHTYLMEEDVAIENATLVRVMAAAHRVLDPYEVLYGYDLTSPRLDETGPRKFESERRRVRGRKRNRAALAFPVRVLVPRNQ